MLINSRMGAGVSKVTLKKYINDKCIQLNEHGDIHSETFVMASFDNLDKNQSYAMVGAGKNKSGLHGTTIQAVYSKPSEKKIQVELVSAGFEDTSAVATIINSDAEILYAPG
jgi:hypothetical protein